MFMRVGEEKKKTKFPWGAWSLVMIFFVGLLFSALLKGTDCILGNPPIISQIKAYEAAVTTFRDGFNAFPGDIPDASVLRNCESGACNPHPKTAGDNIIGSPDFFRTLKPQISKTTVPANSAYDETTLFWMHLLKADLISGVTEDGLKNDTAFAWGITHPKAKIGGGFIVGYADGEPLPKYLSPFNTGMKGTILVQLSKPDGSIEPNAPGQQPISPAKAAQIDRKMDDGKPDTGFVQAYGSPYCFFPEDVIKKHLGDEKNWTNDKIEAFYREMTKDKDNFPFYQESADTKDCGLIFRIQG